MTNYRPAPLLFCSRKDIGLYYSHATEQATKEIRELNRIYFLGTSPEDLLRHFEAKYQLDSLKLNLDDISTTDEIVGVDISQDFQRAIFDRSQPYYAPMPMVNFHIPYEGDKNLFDFTPYIDLNPPRGIVERKYLVVPVVAFDGNISRIAPAFEREKSKIISSVEALNKQIESGGIKFSASVLQAISAQKQVFEKQQSEIDALPYPKKIDSKEVVPVLRRTLPISLLPSATSLSEENATLPLKEYDFILETLFGMARVMESSPDDFKTLSEPALRQHFLVPLNAMYQGQAKGEVFNGAGKTDILIPYKNANIFIAECKFYEGQESILSAISQLMGYLMWRDTKSALILFSRRKDFSNVLEVVRETVIKHPLYIRTLKTATAIETLFRYEFKQQNDPKRRLLLSVLVFNIPTE